MNKKLKDNEKQSERDIYGERNYTIWLFGTDDDFPVKPVWDGKDLEQKYKKAELWVSGSRYNLIDGSKVKEIEGSKHFWGVNTVGRKFDLEIHPAKHNADINLEIQWDHDDIQSILQKAYLVIDQPDKDTQLRINLLIDLHLTIPKESFSKADMIRGRIETILGSGDNFSGKIIFSSGNDVLSEIQFGIDEGATDGLDPHKGEQPLDIDPDTFTAGFSIQDDGKDRRVLSQIDIKSPVGMNIAEITLTIVPKYPEDTDGMLTFCSKSDAN